MSELSIDTFGKIMDNFLKRPMYRCWALKPIYKSIHDDILDHSKHEHFIDTILALVKKDLMDVAEEATA